MQRWSFLSFSVALAASTAARSAPADAVGLVETSDEFDLAAFDKRVSRSAEIRQVWDAGRLYPQILGGVKNSLNGFQFGMGIAADHVVTAFVTHNESNVLLYGNAAWTKYRLGEVFGVRDPSGAVVESNIFVPSRSTGGGMHDPNDVHGFYQDASVTALQKRGVMFFACNTALVQQAEEIARAGIAGSEMPDAIATALRRSLVPGVMLVPSGVAAVTYLQSRYHYGYITE